MVADTAAAAKQAIGKKAGLIGRVGRSVRRKAGDGV
jgi:hypothetical protein